MPPAPKLERAPDTPETRRRTLTLLVGLLFSVYAAFSLYQGASGLVRTANALQVSRSALGRVRAVESGVPRILFNDGTVEKDIPGAPCRGSACPAPGATVDVVFAAGDPPFAAVNSFETLWWPHAQQLLISLLALLAGGLAFLFSRPPIRR
jgi:hypothetical protein